MAFMMILMELMASCDCKSSGDHHNHHRDHHHRDHHDHDHHHHRGHHQLMASCDGERSGDVREGQTRLMERQGGTKVHMAKTANLHYVYNLIYTKPYSALYQGSKRHLVQLAV